MWRKRIDGSGCPARRHVTDHHVPPSRALSSRSTADVRDGYPIKANDNSGIFHVPGGRFYARTVTERCYANSADAVRDGYRPAKA